MIRRAEVNCWVAGAERARHARTRVGMTRPDDVKAEKSKLKVLEGGAGPWVGASNSSRRDVGARVRIFYGIEVETGVL